MRGCGQQEFRDRPFGEFYAITGKRQFWKRGPRAEDFPDGDGYKYRKRSHNHSIGDILELSVLSVGSFVSTFTGSGPEHKCHVVVYRRNRWKHKRNLDGSRGLRFLTICRNALRRGYEFAATNIIEHFCGEFRNSVGRE